MSNSFTIEQVNKLIGDPDYYVRQWSSVDNPAYPKEEYEKAKASMSNSRAAMRYDGLFMRMEGLVYPDFKSCIIKHVDPPEGQLVGGMDFGWNDPFCALLATRYTDVDGRDILYFWYERYKRMTTIAQHSRRLPGRGEAMWYADPSRPGSIAELRIAGHVVRKGVNDIQLGIDAVNNRIHNGTVKISDKLIALMAEAEEYHYPEKDDEIIGEKPKDAFNHALDPFRYTIASVDKRNMAA